MILDAMFAQLKSVAEGWAEEASRRRRYVRLDPLADMLDHNAGELKAVLEQIASDTYYLTAEDYAQLHDVTPQTVRAWIKRGELPALDTERGPRIRRDERRRKRA